MRIKKILMATVIGMVAYALGGCSSTKITRVEPAKTIDLSGRWNDTDSRLVAEEMISDCLQRPWINHFNERNNRDPVVIVGIITNRSHEHIDAQLFVEDLEQSLINSGKVKFVASKQERLGVRDERDEQSQGYTDKDTIKKKGKETGADFMIIGSVNSIKDETKGKYVILYQVNLELVDLENNQKVWIGQKEIKKMVQKSKYSL